MTKKISKISTGKSLYPEIKKHRENIIRNTFGNIIESTDFSDIKNRPCPVSQDEGLDAIELNKIDTKTDPGIRHTHADTIRQNAEFLVKIAQKDDDFPEHYKKCMKWAFKNADYDLILKIAFDVDKEKRLKQNQQTLEDKQELEERTEMSYMQYLFDEVLQSFPDYKSPKQLIKESIDLLSSSTEGDVEKAMQKLREALSSL